jgi:hypothetical protein
MPSTRGRRSGNKCALRGLALLSSKAYIEPMQRRADTIEALPSVGECRPEIDDSASRCADVGHFTRWKHLRRPNFASSDEIVAHLKALRED